MADTKAAPALVSLRLSIMMFIQFFIWGAWYVTAPRYLGTIGFDGSDFGWTYSVGPIAGIISPFFVGMIADRFFSTERVLGLMHLLAGGAMIGAVELMKVPDPNPTIINLVFFAHMLCYFPTLALVNSLSMSNMTDTEKQFPLIRVFGTIGWIVAGITLGGFSMGLWDGFWDSWAGNINQFYLAAGAAIVLGLYSFTLPHTPPPAKGKAFSAREALGIDAFVLLKRPSFLVFMISSFLICIPLAFYYQLAERAVAQAEVADPPFKMTFGQMSEIIFMVLMPFFFARLGVKWMLLIGMLAWVARYALFAIGAPDHVAWMLILGIVLHGICYDFFFVTGQIYTDKAAPKAIRGQAQGMLVLFTLGLGMFIGAKVGGFVEEKYTPQASLDLREEAKQLGDEKTKLEEAVTNAKGQLADADETKKAELNSLITTNEARIKAIPDEIDAKNLASLQAMDWKMIWLIPCVAAAAVMLIFAVVFKDDSKGKDGEDVDASDVAEAAAQEDPAP